MSEDRRAVQLVEELVRSDYARLVRAVALTCGSARLAEDATQEALSRAWQRAAAGEEFSNLAGWVVVVASNDARSGIRREHAEARAVARLDKRSASAADDLGLALELRELWDAVAGLPHRQRQVVVLYYFMGLPVAEAAEQLGISAGTAKNALFRARAALGRALRTDEADQEVTP